ncbi:hypothetical protein GE061_010842 [Apolygus lucorum]|uniref:Uncharacterized protein n=1 Tax=Apolygus lucorum TaxID=248454 RepID=A0A6A4K0X5_APOLU|nr:hypothetical protein GE061_010842 [Apolygus lucorum]
MSSKIHSVKTTKKKKKELHKKQSLPNKGIHRRNKLRTKVDEEASDSNGSSSMEYHFPLDYFTDSTEDSNETSSSNISQEFSDEDKLMTYYETKVRGSGLFELASDESSEGSDLPRRLKVMINGFRKQNFQSGENKNIPRKLPIEQTDKKPTICTSKRNTKGGNAAKTKNASKLDQNLLSKNFSRPHKNVPSEKRRIANNDQRKPPKDEAVVQKSSYPNRGPEWRNKPEESKTPRDLETGFDSFRQKPGRPPLMGLPGARSKTKSQDRPIKADGKERRNKIIEYLGQIDEAEKALQPSHLKGEEEDSSEAVDNITSREALLRKYGFELTSKDDLLRLGGAADRKRKRNKRKVLFPSSSSSSSGSDLTLDGNEIESTLKSFLGKGAEDIDVNEIIRHGRKWRNCLEEGECHCRPPNDKENERKKEDEDQKLKQFLDIFDGKDPPHHEYTREDLLKAHEKIGPWVHDKCKRLDKFIESGKYSPEYLLNIWDGRMSGDSSGDEPNFDKFRQEYNKKLNAHAEEGTTMPSEDRVPSLQENNWFLFPTPITRMYGKGETVDPKTPNSRATMEAIAIDLKRKREADRTKEYLEQRTFPEPHLYPRPIDLTKPEESSVKNPLLGLFTPRPANK